MIQSDESFREEYKPLTIPAAFQPGDTQENKILYALAQLGEATSDQVVEKIEELQPGSKDTQLQAITEAVLSGLYEKGLLKGTDHNGKMSYDLSKITEPNKGGVNPDLLAPGLD